MSALSLLMVWLSPLLLAAFSTRACARWLVVLAPLPALAVAVSVPVGASVSLPWLLLGVELGLDHIGRVFLLFSGLLWLVAGLYAAGSMHNDREAARFRLFFLLAMAGNLGLIVARDMVSFYFGFTLMGLAAYGLVAHPGSQQARRAARRYLVWTIAGELVLFVAVVMLAAQTGAALTFAALASNPPSGFVVLLLFAGFGIKLALPGLHFWLPQTYAVAPPAAAAVLSGTMIKAGLLGWLRFLPPGDTTLTVWGQALMVAGVAGIFFGALTGLLQRRPRLVLGYSSISKMGVLVTGMGAALAWPSAAPALTLALVLYAAHHALVKGALFLGLGLVERRGPRPWLLLGLGFLALALAAAPLTSGALAKSALSAALPQQAGVLVPVFAASAFATTLLMARFLFLAARTRAGVDARLHPLAVIAWLLLLAVTAAFPFAFADAGKLVSGAVPLSAGAALAVLALLAGVRMPARRLTRRQGLASRRTVARLAQVIAATLAAARRSACTLRTSLYNGTQAVRRMLTQRLTGLHTAAEDESAWPLAASVSLGIGFVLLSIFLSVA